MFSFEKSTIDYINGCNDNYDGIDGNFDDNNDKKHTNIISFEYKCTNFRYFYLVKYRFQGTFYCPKSSKKCVCILATFYSQ